MTESEWLASSDPQAMLRLYTSDAMPWLRGAPAPIVSGRKLRLFACACCYGVSEELGKDAEQCTEWKSGPAKNAANWAMAWAGDQKQPTLAERANLLRDIVGNPFRPVALPCNTGCKMMTSGRGDKPHHCHTHHKDVEYVGHDKRTRYAVCPDSLEYFRWKYCTPTVLAIAQAAYEERPGRKCEECNGTGMIGTGYGQFGWKECEHCHRTRRIDDGTLDPVTLAILADAMEDAGCPEEEDCYCERAEAIVPKGAGGQMIMHRCYECRNTGRKPSPILSHLRSPGPHVRGCWALDLILGKE